MKSRKIVGPDLIRGLAFLLGVTQEEQPNPVSSTGGRKKDQREVIGVRAA